MKKIKFENKKKYKIKNKEKVLEFRRKLQKVYGNDSETYKPNIDKYLHNPDYKPLIDLFYVGGNEKQKGS